MTTNNVTNTVISGQNRVERGPGIDGWRVRAAWAERLDFAPTAEHVARGLDDAEWCVRAAWAERRDFAPTAEQIARGTDDESITA